MDPLSDVLSLLKPRSHVSAGFSAGTPWAIRFDRHDGIKFNAVVAGGCWLAMDGVAEPVRLEAGDCFLLAQGRPFRLASDLAVPAADAAPIFQSVSYGGVAVVNGGGDFFLAGSRFLLDGHHAEVLLGVLPPIVHIRQAQDQAALRWALDRMRHELREPQPGGVLVAQHLAHLMLVQALRLHLAGGPAAGAGWLSALAHPQMGAAIGALHADPARRWTVQDLARRVGMSRTAFAVAFKKEVGQSPMGYLTRWRMLLAGSRLAGGDEPIAAIALSLGYESESAFGAAFKRVMGCAPRRYGRERAPA